MRSWPIWLGAVGAFSTVIFIFEGGPDMIRLHWHSESTIGNVVAIDRSNHMATTIRYRVRRVAYERTFPQRTGFDVGAQVSVFNDPSDPMRATTDNPADGLWKLVSRSVIGGAFLSLGIVFMMSFPLSWPFRPIFPFLITPRILSIGVLVGVIVGAASSVFSGRVPGKLWVLVAFALSGLLTCQAFRIPNNAGWWAFARSRLFLVALLLLVIAQLMLYACTSLTVVRPLNLL